MAVWASNAQAVDDFVRRQTDGEVYYKLWMLYTRSVCSRVRDKLIECLYSKEHI